MPASQLDYAVHVAEGIPTTTTDVPPDLDKRMWSPTSATLITGEQDAVLVDPLFTQSQAEALRDWVTASGKNLTAVYITHGHPDHWLGLGFMLEAFPSARAFALPSVIAQMRAHATAEVLAEQWQSRFTEPLAATAATAVIADPVPSGGLRLEGDELVPVELGHTDSDDTTCLHVPSIGVVVAGDAAYNNVHLYLGDSGSEGRHSWLRALYRIEQLHPRAVVAGHKDPSASDRPEIIAETRGYIRDFEAGVAATSTTLDLYRYMKERYPQRINPGALWGSARAAKN
ncbi:MAG TPA: MBL fold metallo-hydrolase [Streptosporangiaceae bacterium]|nr:MBL fold metallo-hydrolase [Streptosporangiaceae bacterium]